MTHKIAIISESFPPYGGGGIDSSHFNLYKKFKAHGYQVRVFTFLDYKIVSDNEDIFRFGPSPFLKKMIIIMYSFINKFRRNILKKKEKGKTAYQFSTVIISNLGSYKMNKSLKKYAPDYIILPDHGVPGYMIRKPRNSKIIHISHHNAIRFLGNELIGFQSESDIKMAVDIERKALKKADFVICPSSYMKEVFIQTFGQNIPVSVIPNIVSEELITTIEKKDIRTIIGLPADSLLVYIPSACSIFKGSKFVFEIIRRLTMNTSGNIGFYLSDDLNNELKYLLNFLPYKNNIYTPGYTDYITNISLIKSCDICVSPTLIENFSMAILEANFCGLPVITFDIGGTSDIIENEMNGFIVPYLDIESLIMKATQLLNEKNKLNVMKESSFKFVNEKFNSEKIFNVFLQTMQII